MPPLSTVPDARGRFGGYGGAYIPETLAGPLRQLAEVYAAARADAPFWQELEHLLATYVGRPTPLQFAARLTGHVRQGAPGGKGGGPRSGSNARISPTPAPTRSTTRSARAC